MPAKKSPSKPVPANKRQKKLDDLAAMVNSPETRQAIEESVYFKAVTAEE